MRNLRNYWSVLLLSAVTLFTASCDDNDEIEVDPNADFDVILEVTDADQTPNETITVDPSTLSITAKVSFTSETDMKRLYITQNLKGQGEEIYTPVESVDLKADKSIDLTGKNENDFEFQFELPVSDLGADGTLVYKFWTTTGKGDFRNVDEDLAIGAGTITITAGTGSNPDAAVKAYSAKILAAPLADGSSSTFISLLDGNVYKINEGAEYAALWDFGYYYTNANGAALASASNYEASFDFVDVDGIAGTTELNDAYFALSSKTSGDFDNAEVSSDLDIDGGDPTSQNITGLEEGDIIEFKDNYGKKGLIRVVDIVGTFNSGDYIKIDIKVQP
jgi:hypothetical protein